MTGRLLSGRSKVRALPGSPVFLKSLERLSASPAGLRRPSRWAENGNKPALSGRLGPEGPEKTPEAVAKAFPARPRPSRQEWPPILSQEIADAIAEREGRTTVRPSSCSNERRTSEVAQLLGVAPDLLRKWKARGFLTLAPGGVSGQGRGNECFWSDEAIAEAREVAASRKPTKSRTRGARQ